MTFLELYTELKFNLGNRSLTEGLCTLARLKLWLNNTEIEIISGFQFFQSEKCATTAMIVAQSTYNLPSDCLAIYSLSDTTRHRKIHRSHYRKFDNVDTTLAGDPTDYIRFGANIKLFPVPNATNTMQLRYCKEITQMSADADEPTIPSPWHECILMGAEARGWRGLGEYKKYVATKNEYLSLVRSRNSEWEIEDSDEEFGLELVA